MSQQMSGVPENLGLIVCTLDATIGIVIRVTVSSIS